MKRIIRLTESDLARIVKRVIMEQTTSLDDQTITKLSIKSGSIGSSVTLSNGETYNYTPEDVTTFPQMVYSGWCKPGEYEGNRLPQGCSATITLENNKRYICDSSGCNEENM
jgi:hypothetical protein